MLRLNLSAVWCVCGRAYPRLRQGPSFTFVTPQAMAQGFVRGLAADGQTAVGDFNAHGFRWTASGGTDYFPDRLGLVDGRAYAVSADGGLVAGGDFQAYRSDGATIQLLGRANHWQYSTARAVSSDGSVIAGTLSDTIAARGQAFVWTRASGMVAIGSEGGPLTQVFAISRDGTTVLGSQGASGFTWTSASGFQYLERRGPGSNVATAINSAQTTIVGLSGNSLPARWVLGQLTELPLPTNYIAGAALCLSANGEIIGGTTIPTTGPDNAFIWSLSTGSMLANDYLTSRGVPLPRGWRCDQVNGISDDGRIFAGRAFEIGAPGNSRGFIATVPAPTSVSVLTLGLLA